MSVNSGVLASSTPKGLSTSSIESQLLAVGESKRSGLILCCNHHAEFAGPGAAIHSPREKPYTAVIAIGAPEIVELTGYAARQKAYSLRIQWVRWLQCIVAQADPVLRIEKLLTGFEEFFGSDTLHQIPNEVLALLAGVLPQTIATVRSQTGNAGTVEASSEDSTVVIINRQALMAGGSRCGTQLRQTLQWVVERFPRSA